MCLLASLRTLHMRASDARSEEYLAATTVEVPSTWPQPSVCICAGVLSVSVHIGNGPFECTGGMGSVCGRYFVHKPKMRLGRSRRYLTTRTQSVPILHQCHSSFVCFKG